MKNKLTVEDKIFLRNVLDLILNDEDLRRGFRQCGTSVREMNRVHGRLENEIDAAIQESSTPA